MTEWSQPRERAEWTHPRRAAKEIISYLSQVETVIDQYAQDDHSYGGADDDEDDDVGREQLMDNILEELKHQTASIMEDRQGSVVAEKMARRLSPLQLRTMLSRCRGYMLSLANNRYSSHVLQTLLSVAGQVVEGEISGDGGDDEEEDAQRYEEDQGAATAAVNDGSKKIDRMQDILLSLVSELSGAWAELFADISGSHVGRGFLQVLGGMPILSEKRGRQSRHAHSIGTAVGPARMGGRSSNNNHSNGSSVGAKGKASATTPAVDPEALEKWSTPYKHRVPRSFVAALGEVTSELEALPASELQTLACGTFGCPLLVMLLRVHGNLATATREDSPGSSAAETMVLPCLEHESTAMKIVKKVLQWDDEERSAQVVYAISGENTASHFLEAVLWLSPRSFFEELYHRCFESKLLEFCEHGVSNFLIQAALQRADDKALAEKMVEAISDNASELLKVRRAGVLWRAAQACVRLRLKPKTQAKILQDIALAVQAGHTGSAPPPPPTSGESTPKAEQDKQAAASDSSPSVADAFKAARAWVPALLSPRLPGEGGLDRLFLNVPGARIVQNALLFDPPVAAPVLKAVAALPDDVLAAVARDNMGSRCLLDPILEAAGARGGGKGGGKNKPAEEARRAILRAFKGHLVAMACDRVAWHILLKCFRGVDMKEKRAIAEELAGGGEQAWSRMSGYPSGRSVLTECMVERFSRSPHEWEDAFKNRDNRAKMLTEILAVESTSTKKGTSGKSGGTSSASASSNREAGKLAPSPFNSKAEGDEDGGKGKEKRRRQRGRGRRGKSSAAAGAPADEDGGGGGGGDDGEGGGAPEPRESVASGKDAKSSKKARKDGGAEAEEGSAVDGAATSKKKKGKAKAKKGGGVAEGGGDTTATTRDTTATQEITKKKKRKRQEGAHAGDGTKAAGDTAAAAAAAAAGGDEKEKGVDLSFVMNAIKKSVSAGDKQAPPSPTATKKSKKKKKKSEASIDGGSEEGRCDNDGMGGARVAGEKTRATTEAGGSTGGEESGDTGKGKIKKKSKKKSKPSVEEDSKWKAVETPAKRRKDDAAAAVAVETEARGKKSKKSGFRMF